MSVANVFNAEDHAEGGIPTFTGGLHIEKPVQDQMQQDVGLSQQQAGEDVKVVVNQLGGASPKPESVGGDFNENDWSPI